MRIEAAVTTISWIPSEAVTGPLNKPIFDSGVTHYDQPPPDIYRHAMNYAKHLLTEGTSGIDMRIMAMQEMEGAQVQFATPGLSVWVTGIPTIDEALKDYRNRHRRTPRPIRSGAWFA